MTTIEEFEECWTPEPFSGCWLWNGSTGGSGYGNVFEVCFGRKERVAHRLAWSLYRGKIPDGLLVLHRCDVRRCVNPQHLFLGTVQDNNADAKAKGRTPRGERSGKAKLTTNQVMQIKFDLGSKSHRQIAREHGVNPSTIDLIALGQTWSHV